MDYCTHYDQQQIIDFEYSMIIKTIFYTNAFNYTYMHYFN